MWSSDGYSWAHCNFVIHILPKINTNFVTTFLNLGGKSPVTVYQSINVSARLVRFWDELVSQPHTTYRKIFQIFNKRLQWVMFYTSFDDDCRFIHTQAGYLFISIYLKQIIRWLCWYNVEVSFKMRGICSLTSCYLLLFARN